MSSLTISAPVGTKPRTSPGKAVANNTADVNAVQMMMVANGVNVKITGKCDATLIKSITAFQKKLFPKEEADGVVDPDGQLFAALLPKYKTYIKELEKQKFYKMDYKGTIYVPEKEYLKIQDQIVKDCKALADIHQRTYDGYEKVHTDFLETVQARDGYLKAVSAAVVVKVSGVALPSTSVATKAQGSITKLKKAAASKDFKTLNSATAEAEKNLDAYYNELLKFHKNFSSAAWKVGTTLQVTTSVGWAVVGAMATPVLVTGLALGPVTAAAVGGAGVSVMQSSANEIGKHLTGEKTTVYDSAKAIIIDGATGAATGAIAGKMNTKWADDISKGIAAKVVAKVPRLTSKQAQDFLVRYLAHVGKDVLAEATSGAINTFGEAVKKGKMPTSKEFLSWAQDTTFKLVSSGPMKAMGDFDSKMAGKHKDWVTKTIFPKWLKASGNKTLSSSDQKKLIEDAIAGTKEQVFKAGWDGAIEAATGAESADKLAKNGMDKVAKDKTYETLVNKAIEDAMKKRKIGTK